MRTTTKYFSPVLLVALLTASVGCAHIDEPSEPAVIVVPSAATTAPEYRGDGSIPHQRYVVRMSDGYRDWEVEFPEVARGYEVRIPLDDDRREVRAGHQSLTRADKELLEHLRRTDPDFERSGVYVGDEHITDRQARREGDQVEHRERDRSEADPAPTRPSYLRGIEQVQRLFEAGQYEAAMIQLSDLEDAYPNDVRIKSMKGTLWLRLGRERLAREAWEQVLQIDPDNQPVQEALRRLDTPADDDFDDFEEFGDDQLE